MGSWGATRSNESGSSIPGFDLPHAELFFELGRALMLETRNLLLDEPFAGVNPALVDDIIEKLFTLRKQGLCLIVVEHDMYTIRTLCDEHFVLMVIAPLNQF